MYRIKGKFAKKDVINKYNTVATKMSKSKGSENELDEHHYAKATSVSSAVSSSSHFRANPLPDVGMVSHEEVLPTCTLKDGNWSDGRFIIELGTLAQGLKGCQHCGQPLHLHNTIMHKTTGLAVSLDVFCPLCNCTSTVQCSKKHSHVYDVNTKASTAILHAGIGVAQFNSMLMCLNIPTVHYSMMNRRFRETGEAIEVVARESMEQAIQEETIEERVAAAVSQKNAGRKYITSVHRKIGISPGTHSFRLLALQDLQFRKRKAIATSHTAKRRKLVLKSKRSQRRFTQEVKEGPQYHPNLQNLAEVSYASIPDGLVIGSECCHAEPHTQIFFDLETTGLGRKSHIIQIAAVSESEKFNVYVRPKVNITSKASQITGLSTKNGELLLNGQIIKSYAIGDALKMFCTFLQNTDDNILFAHNCKSFDSQILTNALISCKLFDTFSCSVHGFVDTLHVFRKVFPGLDSYKQISLAQHFLKSDYDAHNALSDVCTLKSIFETAKIECANYISASFTTNYCFKKYIFSCNVDKHFASLEPLFKKKVITSATARKIAGSDLCFQHLSLAYQRDGFNGVKSILSETIDNVVRVTKSVKIIQSIVDYISENVS